jgi:hypothetical protein
MRQPTPSRSAGLAMLLGARAGDALLAHRVAAALAAVRPATATPRAA